MRTRIILTSLLVLAGGAVALVLAFDDEEPATRASATGERVVAGFYPLAFAAQEVSPDAQVENLTPPGVEPHDLEVSSEDVRALQSADLVLVMGKGFQPQLEEAAAQGDAEMIELLDTPDFHLLPDGDPHVWLDPVRYGAILERIATALGDGRAAAPMIARLRDLDHAYQRGLSDCRRDSIVTSHEAFAYLAQRYGLRQISILGLSPEAEPSPAELARVIDRVRRTGATTIYGESLLSARLAETVGRETGARTAILNPIEGLTDEEVDRGESYFTLMRENLTALRRGLGCR